MGIGDWRPCVLITQKDRPFLVCSFSAEELDGFCESPRLDEEKLLDDASKYQRDIKSSRLGQIKKFWNKSNSFLPNSMIVKMKEEDALELQYLDPEKENNPFQLRIKHTGDSKVKIAEILDGQHRMLGCNSSTANKDEGLVVTLLRPEHFGQDEIGKMFIEMNSEAKKIGELHEMHLQARYGITPFAALGKNAYNLMRKLAEQGGTNPLKGKIKLLDGKQKEFSGKAVSLAILQLWDTSDAEGGLASKTENNAYNSIRDYLNAVLNKVWKDDWNDETSSLHSQDVLVEVVLGLFPNFHLRANRLLKSGQTVPKEPQWILAIDAEDKHSTKLATLIDWMSPVYRSYTDGRQQTWIRKSIETLLKKDSKGDLDFKKILGTNDTLSEYLDQHIGDFDIKIVDDKGSALSSPLKHSQLGNMSLTWNQATLARKKSILSIIEISTRGSTNLKRKGNFSADTKHKMKGAQIPRGWKGGFESGKKYRITVVQNTASGTNVEKSIDIEIT